MQAQTEVMDAPIAFVTDEVAAAFAGEKSSHRVMIDEDSAFKLSVIEKENPADIKNQRVEGDTIYFDFDFDMHLKSGETVSTIGVKTPFGGIGSHLWVQEEHRPVGWDFDCGEATLEYKDGKRHTHSVQTEEEFELNPNDDYLIAICEELLKREVPIKNERFLLEIPTHLPYWRTATEMPKFASRLGFEIVGMRIERLNLLSMTDDDIKAEGADHYTVSGLVADRRIGFYQTLFLRHWDAKTPSCTWGENPWVCVLELKKIDLNYY